jgi:hypothetical protein
MKEKQKKDDDGKPKHNFKYQSSKDLTATQPLP